MKRKSVPSVPASVAARSFLSDIAQVSGYALTSRSASSYVERRALLTAPDPWFYAGLVALEASKVCDLFAPNDAGALLREIAKQADEVVNQPGRRLATLIFALMGRLGYGAIVKGTKVPDHQIGPVILAFFGSGKAWAHLIPNREAHRQVCAALRLGRPFWWRDYCDGGVEDGAPASLALSVSRTAPAVPHRMALAL